MKASIHLKMTLSLAALFSLTASLAFLFMAGCTGDLKGGTLGDPVFALHYENVGNTFLFLGLAIGTALLMIRDRAEISWYGPVLILFGGTALWLIGMQVEAWAVQICL